MSHPTVQDINETLDVIKGIYGQAMQAGAVSPDLQKIFDSTLGLVPFNLEVGAKLLAPVLTPLRNRISRNKGRGTSTIFKAITSYNSGTYQSSWATEGNSGPVINNQSVNVLMPYKIQALKQLITFESQWWGAGQVDAKALAIANLLRAFMLEEEYHILFGVPTPAVTGASAGGAGVSIGGLLGRPTYVNGNLVGSTTGGSIAADTYTSYATFVTAPSNIYPNTFTQTLAGGSATNVTGAQESLPQVTGATVTTSGATSTITITPPALVGGAIAVNIYLRNSTDTTYNVYTTNGAPVVVKTFVAPTTTGFALPTADNSASTAAFPGILAQVLASGSGASVYNKLQNPNASGSLYTLSTPNNAFGDLDNLFFNMWNTAKADPELLLVNAFESMVISKATIGAGTPYYVTPAGDQAGGVAGYRVSRFTNNLSGNLLDIVVHPVLPQGTLLALSNRLPGWYPGSDIPSVWSMEMNPDYQEFDYPPTSPAWPVEIRNSGALLCYIPLIQGIITGISKS